MVWSMATVCLLLSAALLAADKDKDKDKDKDRDKDKAGPNQSVDAGTFGVFLNGHRVATETFSIQQNSAGSVVTSDFKAEAGGTQAAQSSELQLTPTGDLRKYEWKETLPDKVQAVVAPNDNFLVERITMNPGEKPQEQPFLLPSSTSILDDYFFVQREVLTWKYLATGCRNSQGRVECPKGQRTQFGTLNPHSRLSMSASMEFSGIEKVPVHGVELSLSRFELKSDAGEWTLWINEQYKLIRIVASDATEVVRD
jgi:hypothetical protein